MRANNAEQRTFYGSTNLRTINNVKFDATITDATYNWTPTAAQVGAVPTSRKVNNKALSADITLTASDVDALPSNTPIPTKTSDLTNDSGYITLGDLPIYNGGVQ